MLRHLFGELFQKGKRPMLKAGEVAPPFEAIDHEGRTVRLKDFAGKRVVLWFYPKADTPGCTKQGCGFRDWHKDIANTGAQVLGVSFDTPADNKAFAEKFRFPFPLLCDVDRKIGLAYKACDTASEAYAKRFTYVIGPDGKIERAIDTKDPGAQAEALSKSLK